MPIQMERTGRRIRRGIASCPSVVLAVALLLTSPGFPGSAGPDGFGLAAQDAGVVEGTVVEKGSGEPVPGATVILADPERRALTDPEGGFRIEGVTPGARRLRVEVLGYHGHEELVEVGGEGVRVEVALERRPLGLQEVVATGTPLRGVAPVQPSQALATEDLELRAADSFGRMLDGEPGLAMRSFGPVAGRPVIRGLGSDRVAVLEGGQRTGDMSETAHDHAVAMEPLLADRVEVVRGPSSLLYGSSALGGVVNLLRRNVPAAWSPGLEGRAALQGASVNRLVAGAGTATYGSDDWGAVGRASVREGGDFRAPGAPAGVLESTHARLATAGGGVGWRGSRWRGGLGADFHDHVYGVPEELDDPDEDVEIRSERQRVTAELDRRGTGGLVRDVELRASAARFFQREVERERRGGGVVEEEIEHEFERLTADATVIATHDARGPLGEGAVGASLRAFTLAATGADEFHPDGRTLAGGVFAFQRYPLGGRLDLQAGVRVEHDRTKASENELFPGFSAERTATTLSGAVGLEARPREGVELGVQLARAHRTPMVEQLYADGPHLGAGRYEVGDPDLRNEVGHGVDLFARYAHRRVQAEGALFANRIHHFVFPRNTGESRGERGLPLVLWSATRARFAGGEMAVDVAVSGNLHVRITGDYVRASRTEGEREPLPFIPPARGSVGATYDTGRWWAGGTARAAARQDRVPDTREPTAGYALLDLNVGARLGPDREHALILRVDNALDAAYRDHLSRVEERRFPMPGRNVSLLYRWRF